MSLARFRLTALAVRHLWRATRGLSLHSGDTIRITWTVTLK